MIIKNYNKNKLNIRKELRPLTSSRRKNLKNKNPRLNDGRSPQFILEGRIKFNFPRANHTLK